tara:strand:- start:194 stop:523 length:330 start_codon:yes stop_codon:yes gene_type:complete
MKEIFSKSQQAVVEEEVVKVVVVQETVEQVDREEQTDNVVHRVEQWEVTVIPMEMSVADQGMTLLVAEAVEVDITQVSVVETQVVTAMEQQGEVEDNLGSLLHTILVGI